MRHVDPGDRRYDCPRRCCAPKRRDILAFNEKDNLFVHYWKINFIFGFEVIRGVSVTRQFGLSVCNHTNVVCYIGQM